MRHYSEKDIPFIQLWVQLKALTKQELEITLSMLDEDARDFVVEILTTNK